MIFSQSPKKFFAKNYSELTKIVLWVLNAPVEHDKVHELLHEYYIAVSRNNTLGKYRKDKASFETYMCMSIRSFVYSRYRGSVKDSKTSYLKEADLAPSNDPDLTMLVDLSRFRMTLNPREKEVLDLLSMDNRPFEACVTMGVSNMTISHYRRKLIDKWRAFCEEAAV